MQKFIKWKFRASKWANMADLAIQQSPNLISRKIWVIQKSCSTLCLPFLQTRTDISRTRSSLVLGSLMANRHSNGITLVRRRQRRRRWGDHAWQVLGEVGLVRGLLDRIWSRDRLLLSKHLHRDCPQHSHLHMHLSYCRHTLLLPILYFIWKVCT